MNPHKAVKESDVGAVECNEAAIFSKTLESQAKDQEIAGFASSYRVLR